MAERFLLIDGYNLMHAAGMARQRYGPGLLEKCRNHLLNFLRRRLSGPQRERTTIVFDAQDAPPDAERRHLLDGMQIIFAPRGSDADTLIEKLIAEHSSPRRLLVVSSDHRLQKAARRRRASFVDSEDFFAEIDEQTPPAATPTDRQKTTPRSDPKFGGRVSEQESEAWLKEFGDIPEAADLEGKDDQWQAHLDSLQDDLDDLIDNEGG